MNYSALSNPKALSRLFEEWKERHFLFLIEKFVSHVEKRIFMYTLLRKAMWYIENVLLDMYHFALNPEIEKFTNKIE